MLRHFGGMLPAANPAHGALYSAVALANKHCRVRAMDYRLRLADKRLI
jgi:hypothetical protein